MKREIDRIALALAKLLSLLLNTPGPTGNVEQTITQKASSELDIDLALLLEMDDHAAIDHLVREKKFSVGHLRDFANVLYETARRSTNEPRKEKLRNKALSIYEYVNKNANSTVYLDVVYRIKELKG